jgi:hypothetical protein
VVKTPTGAGDHRIGKIASRVVITEFQRRLT